MVSLCLVTESTLPQAMLLKLQGYSWSLCYRGRLSKEASRAIRRSDNRATRPSSPRKRGPRVVERRDATQMATICANMCPKLCHHVTLGVTPSLIVHERPPRRDLIPPCQG